MLVSFKAAAGNIFSHLRIIVLIMTALAAICNVFTRPPMPQDLSYHIFADTRTYFGVPNWSNVMLLAFFPRGLMLDGAYWLLFTGYALAKVLEYYDAELYLLTQHWLSGHALKHIVAATAIYVFRPDVALTRFVSAR